MKFSGSIMRALFNFSIIISLISIGSCATSEDDASDPPSKPLSMAVITDTHLYDFDVGAVDDKGDMIVIEQGEAINTELITQLEKENPDIVIHCGDLSRNGAMASHQLIANKLAQLETSGIKVYVVPGNHDIQSGDLPITSSEFATLYDQFGFAEAMDRDPNSLSYVVEPRKGLWLLSMDAATYTTIDGKETEKDREFSAETISWISAKLEQAKNNKIQVIGFMHYNVIEHFPQFGTFMAGDMIKNYLANDASWDATLSDWADLGLNVIFTGHTHASDIAVARHGNSYTAEVLTNSIVGWPSGYRMVSFDDSTGILSSKTTLLESIDSDLGGVEVQTYLENHFEVWLSNKAVETIMGIGMMNSVDMSDVTADLYPYALETLKGFYRGDEKKYLGETFLYDYSMVVAGLSDPYQQAVANGIGDIINQIWNDDTPDSNFKIDLKTGDITTDI